MIPQGQWKKKVYKRLKLALPLLAAAALCAACAYPSAGAESAGLREGAAGPPPRSTGEGQALTASAAPSAAPAPTPEPTPEPAPPAAEHPAYEELYPELYAREAARASVNEEKTVYLTFDDGPSGRTPEILDILQEYGVQATFFTVGQTDDASKAYLRRIVEEGHALGVHSFSHDYRKIYAGVEEFLEDFKAQYDLIYEATGTYPQIFRFPGGSINGYNGHIYQEIIAEMTRRGFVYFDWNVSAADAAPHPTAATVLAGATHKISGLRRAFVLMHDSAPKTYTVEALPAVIEAYQEAGFTFRTLSPEVVPLIFPYPDDR